MLVVICRFILGSFHSRFRLIVSTLITNVSRTVFDYQTILEFPPHNSNYVLTVYRSTTNSQRSSTTSVRRLKTAGCMHVAISLHTDTGRSSAMKQLNHSPITGLLTHHVLIGTNTTLIALKGVQTPFKELFPSTI